MTLEELNSMLPAEQKKQACLNQTQVSSLLGVSCGTLSNWRAEAISLEYIKVGSGKKNRILYSKTKILEFLNSQNIKTA